MAGTNTTGGMPPPMAAGGTTGQVLTKKSDTSYDTEWTTPAGGGGTVTGVTASAPLASSGGTAPNLTLLQKLINADRAVIARPTGGGDFEVLASAKAAPAEKDPRGARLRRPKFVPGEDVPMRAGSPPVLLLRQSLGGAWVVAGPVLRGVGLGDPARGAIDPLRRAVAHRGLMPRCDALDPEVLDQGGVPGGPA